MHQMPMVPQQRNFVPMLMPGLKAPPPPPQQATYHAPQQYPKPGPLPPPPPRPSSFAPENVPPPSGPPLPPPPPPPSPPPPLPPAPPTHVVAQSWNADVEGKEDAPDGGRDAKTKEAVTHLIVSDDSDMDMDGDEDLPSRHLSPVNSSPVTAECIGDVNVPKSVSDVSSLDNDLPPGHGENAKTANVTVEGGSPFRLIQGYASDDSEDEVDACAASSVVLSPKDNQHSHPRDRNTEIGHQKLPNAEENVNAPPGTKQNGEATKYQLKDESNPVKHDTDVFGHLVKKEFNGSEFDGVQKSKRHGRSQRKRSRSKSPQDTSRSPLRINKRSPSRSLSPVGLRRQSRLPLAKRGHPAGECKVSEGGNAQQESLVGMKKLDSSSDLIGKGGDNAAPHVVIGQHGLGRNLTSESSQSIAASANAYDPHKMQITGPPSQSQSELNMSSSAGNQVHVSQSSAGVPFASVPATQNSMTCNMHRSYPQSLCPPEQVSSSNMVQLPGQPLLASSEVPQTRYQHNVIASANEFVQNQMGSYPAPDLSHPRPLDFHHHLLQPAVPSHQQPAGIPVENAPVPPPDRWSEYSGGVGLSYHQPLYGQQQPPGSSDSGTHFVYPSLQRFPSNLPGSGDLGPISDAGLPKSSIKPHYNPFASTFEQTDPILNIDPAVSPNAVGSASTKAVEHMNTLSPFGQSFPRSRTHAHESSAEAMHNVQKQFHSGFTYGAPYDPLLDSIEPSSSSINKVGLGKEKNRGVNDSRDASKVMNVEVVSENMHGLGVVAESEVEGLGEVAADTETGVVENASPEFLGAKDWSSDIPGDIGNDQSLDKSKKSKDSRSMKLFKVAVADFVKEVLKPSWRQGNMSKEAFKTIVKKTVEKVSNSVPSSHIPKTPAKIKQYVQSSQRKVTKLVMGYVDKYAKL
uniref:SFR19-like C-terminal domain-containing protein n=1 Tax=Arundo donax TaxID=35708 RepID=A0A0A9CPE8_ARUDO